MGGWETTTKSYACAAPFPYAWNFTYTQTGSPSVSTIGANFEVSPGRQDVLLTNWNLFATDCIKPIRICSAASGTPATTARTATRAAARAHQALDILRIEFLATQYSICDVG